MGMDSDVGHNIFISKVRERRRERIVNHCNNFVFVIISIRFLSKSLTLTTNEQPT